MSHNLPHINDWQYQITLIASHLTLNLLERDKIIEFTHYLMDNGYYDDLMLDILDDNKNFVVDELSQLLKNLFRKLNFIEFDKEQAKYFLTVSFITPLIQKPFKLPFLYENYINNPTQISIQALFNEIEPFLDYSCYYGVVIDNPIIDKLGYLAYEIEWNIENQSDAHFAILKFLTQCENWLYHHTNILTPIIQQIGLQK